MIAALFAVDQAGGMGWHGSIPWPHNKDDMRWFKKATQDQIVVMGRRTWESPDMPSPLPGRFNVVFTHDFFQEDSIEQIRGDVPEGLRMIKKNNKKKNIFVIGGPNLLIQSRPVLERIFVTRIPGEYLSDTQINLTEFLEGMKLSRTMNLGSCTVEEYINESIPSSTTTRSRKRKTED